MACAAALGCQSQAEAADLTQYLACKPEAKAGLVLLSPSRATAMTS